MTYDPPLSARSIADQLEGGTAARFHLLYILSLLGASTVLIVSESDLSLSAVQLFLKRPCA